MASWPKTKEVKIGDRTVSVTTDKAVTDGGHVVITATAICGTVTYAENWTLPNSNHEYLAAQAQIDFDAHVKKVALGAVGRCVAHEVSEALV
jgi:hypothetical protein